MSELYIQATNADEFDTYFDSLAQHITSYLAVDSSVRLECDTTLGFSIPAQQWLEVTHALAAGLRAVFFEISTQAPLSVPCSLALVELFVHQIWSPLTDTRGVVHVSIPAPANATPFSPSQTLIWEAIFGEQGYFHTYRSHIVVAGASYLAADGGYKPCQFYLGKEGKASKKSKTVKSDLKIHTVHPSRKILRIKGPTEASFRALDASTDDFTGLSYLFPALNIQAVDAQSLQLRLVPTTAVCEELLIQKDPSFDDPAIRTAIWLFNATDHGLALRGSVAVRPSHGLLYEFQRSLLIALTSFNKREISDDLGPLPTSLGIVRLLNACLLCLNPYMLFLDLPADIAITPEVAFKYAHALHRIVRPLTCPVSISESLRALRTAFIPYAGSEDAYAGMTLCCCTDFIGTPLNDPFDEPLNEVVKFTWHPLDLNFFEPDHVDDTNTVKLSVANKSTPTEPLATLKHYHSQVDLINQLGVTMSSLLQFAPALSYDSNRIPISAKYILGFPSHNSSVTEMSNDYSFELSFLDTSSASRQLYHEGYLHLLVLADSSQDVMCFLANHGGQPKNTFLAALDGLRLALLEAYATFNEFNTGTFHYYNELPADEKHSTVQIPTASETASDASYFFLSVAVWVKGDVGASDHDVIDVFTKIPGLERVVGYVSRCVHMPIVYEPSVESSARLFLLGFLRGQTNTNPDYLALAQANLRDSHDPKKAATPSGALLMELSKKGGFGFGALLGPLLGEGAKAISSLFGAPEIGEAIAGVANVAGSLLPF